MSNIKKVSVLTFLLSTGLLIGLGANRNNSHQAKAAAEPWSETISAVNVVINYGAEVHENASADYRTSDSGRFSYFVRHGYLTNSKIAKYDNVSSTDEYTENATFTSNTATDSSCEHWQFKINGGKTANDNEDGVILGFTANTSMTYSIDTMTFKGWPNSGRVNTYVKRYGSSTYTSIQSVAIANTSTEYSQSAVDLYSGDTVYFEYIQLYGSGNLQQTSGSGLPVFKFNELVVERTVNTSDLARGYYNNALAADADADYARDMSGTFEYGVRHGRLDTKTIEKFDTVTAANATSIDYKQSSDTENTHAAITYGRNIWTANNDGVIYVVKALEEITFSSSSVTFSNGWFGFYLNYFLKEAGGSTLITIAKETYAAGSTNPTAAVAPIKLSAGDEMYFEVRYAWSSNPRRSIQDNSDAGAVPTFVISQADLEEVSVEANTFMAKYMKLAAISGEGTGVCKTGGWYTAAKAAFNAMSSEARELFLTDSDYEAGADRLRAWATANGEVINASNLLVASSNNTFLNIANNNNSAIIIVIITLIGFAFAGLFVISHKRKHQ